MTGLMGDHRPKADTWTVRLQAFTSRYVTPPAAHRIIYRLTGGRLGASMPSVRPRVLLLTVIGRRSGQLRTTPLVYFEIDGDLVVAATNNGRSADPAWLTNLRAQPSAEVQVGTRKHAVRAREAEGDERRRLWTAMVERHPLFARYERSTERSIPVVVLELLP